jgi:hypothetical protein
MAPNPVFEHEQYLLEGLFRAIEAAFDEDGLVWLDPPLRHSSQSVYAIETKELRRIRVAYYALKEFQKTMKQQGVQTAGDL